jgi:hypothetical protein
MELGAAATAPVRATIPKTNARGITIGEGWDDIPNNIVGFVYI